MAETRFSMSSFSGPARLVPRPPYRSSPTIYNRPTSQKRAMALHLKVADSFPDSTDGGENSREGGGGDNPLAAAAARPYPSPTAASTTGDALFVEQGWMTSLFRVKRKSMLIGIASCLLGLYYLVIVQGNGGSAVSFESHSVIDKRTPTTPAIWDVDSPPIPLDDNQTIESLMVQVEQQHLTLKERLVGRHGLHIAQDKRAASVTDSSHTEIQHYKDDKVPGTSSATLHAADSLLCRKSVVNFVINATDAKDECEGLKKAFDKTCSNDNTGKEGHRTLKRRKTFADKLQYAARARLLLYRTTRFYKRWARFFFGQTPVFFFAEEEVASGYDDAVCLVQQNIDTLFQRDVQKQWRRRRLDDANDEAATIDTEEDSSSNTTNVVKLPLPSLDIPTANQHISEKVAGEMLMIRQGEDTIEKAVNQSLSKQAAEARDDAAKSSKVMSDTNAAVNALLNDPSSIEARTCCASILYVYHENCSKDEEEDISDGRLFFVVFVMAMCGMVKSLIRHFKILWLPEAAGCIIVGGEFSRQSDGCTCRCILLIPC